MDGAGSGSGLHILSNSQENGYILDQTSNSMAQDPDLSSRLSTTAPQNPFFRPTNSVSLIVTHGSAPAPMPDARMAPTTCSITQAIPCDLLSSSAAIILPSTKGTSNQSDHGTIRFSSQQGPTHETHPRAEYVVPSKGPMSGGIEVTIVGTNFPHTLPLSVYFSTKLALITRKTRETIRCFVPAVSSPGIVDVRIVVEAPESVPEIDCKLAKFTYKDERMTELMVHVRCIASRGGQTLWKMTTTPTQRAAGVPIQPASKNLGPDASNSLQPLEYDQLEEIAIQILSSCSTYHDWRKVVSLPNEYGQTLAHLAITLGYSRLLQQLILWEIDRSVRDATGATALHFAYLYNRPDCVSLLTRNGADQQVCGEPGEGVVPFNGILNESSSIAAREETLQAKGGPVPKWQREKNRFSPRQANLFECGTNSLGLAGLDLNPQSPTTDQTGTGVVGVQPPGAGVQSIGSPNRRPTIDTSLGSDAHPETSYSHTNVTRSSLWTSSHLGTLSARSSDTSVSSRASWLQNETLTSAQVGDSGRTADGSFLKAVVPSKGGSVLLQTATFPTTDMPDPHDEGSTIQECENVKAGATICPAELERMRLFESPPSTGTPTPASQVSPSTPIPVTSPTSPATTTPASKSFGDSLQSLLGTNQSYSPDTRDQPPIDLVYGGLIAPKLPPPKYEFREMTLGCRFVATDQWLTTRVDTSWTVSQVKFHMLTKLYGVRRDQLKVPNYPGEYHADATTSSHPVNIRENKTIATSNDSSIVFEVHESTDLDSLSHPPNHRSQPLPRSVESELFNTNSGIPSLSSFIQSVPTVYQAHVDPKAETVKGPNTDRHSPYRDFASVATPPAITDLGTNKVNKEDMLDELLDRLETEAKERIHKVADKYCLTSFLYGNILDDRMTLGEYRLRPFELLEIQERSRLLRIARRVYLDAYWESPVEVRMRGGSERQGIEGIRKLARQECEEEVQQELQRGFVAEFMSNPVDETREEPRGMTALMTLPWKNTPEARAREHETRRRKLLQKAEQEETKRQKREVKEAAMERWMERLAIVEGHRLNVWKNREDDHPEQSWDLRRVVGVSGPIKQPEFPPGSVAAAYAALKNSNALNIVRVETKQKSDIEEETKAKRPHHELHIQFSMPMSPVNEGPDPVGAAEKLKRELKKMTRPSGHSRSASLPGLPSNSADPFNQGLKTSTIKGTESATLVLRLPDERSLENLSRIIHRSAGKYPLNQKRRRAQEANAVGATTGVTTKQGTKFHPYPEWRERMLQKCIASGRYGTLASSTRKVESKPNTGVYELPPELQKLLENEAEESSPGSMASDAEWEGWRRELELEGPGSSGLKVDSTEPPFVTESYSLLRSRRRKNTPTLGREKGLERIIKGTTEHPVRPYLLTRGQLPVSPPLASSGAGLRSDALHPTPPSNSSPTPPRQSLSVPNREKSATVASFGPAAKRSLHHTDDANHDTNHDANHDLMILPPNLPDTMEEGRLPGLGGGLSSSYQTANTVTTIAALRSADNAAAPRKGMARVWSNKGKRRDKTEDNPTGEEAIVESAPLAVDHPNDSWTRSYNEGLDRLRHMSPSGLRQSGSKGGLLKSFSLRDR